MPLVQRYNLGSQFAECRTPAGRLDFEMEMRESAEALLPCVAERECTVTGVECTAQEGGDTFLEVTLRSTTLQHVDSQRDLLNTAFAVIKEIRVLVEEVRMAFSGLNMISGFGRWQGWDLMIY